MAAPRRHPWLAPDHRGARKPGREGAERPWQPRHLASTTPRKPPWPHCPQPGSVLHPALPSCPQEAPPPPPEGHGHTLPPSGSPSPGLPWACPGPRCRKRPCRLKAGPGQSHLGACGRVTGRTGGAGGPGRGDPGGGLCWSLTALNGHLSTSPSAFVATVLRDRQGCRGPAPPRSSPSGFL